MNHPEIDERIVNRRHDDIVCVIRHDFFVEASKNKIVIEFINDYGKKFFNLRNEILYSSSNEEFYFENILENKTAKIISDNLNEVSNDSFKSIDLADILRKISNFSVINGELKSIIVNIRVFHIHEKDQMKRKKNIKSFYYYLIIREIDLEMKIAEFRINFFRKLQAKICFDQITNIPDLKSSINEIKMLIEFNKKEQIDVVFASIEIDLKNDQILFCMIIDQIKKEIRNDDYLGILKVVSENNRNQILLILHNCDIYTAYKPLFRIYTSICSNHYIFEKYQNRLENIIYIGYTSLKNDDNFEKILLKLDIALKNSKNLLDEVKVSSVE
jgi:hypothetical protein